MKRSIKIMRFDTVEQAERGVNDFTFSEGVKDVMSTRVVPFQNGVMATIIYLKVDKT